MRTSVLLTLVLVLGMWFFACLAIAQEAPAPVQIHVTESIAVGDEVETLPSAFINEPETVTVTDTVNITLQPLLTLNVAETITVTDEPETLSSAMISVTETIGVNDSPSTNITDQDNDGDGVPNSGDNCPDTPNPNQENSDGDFKGDACDGCPNDSGKIDPGVCGCGVADTDSDGDGTPDCNDLCPDDPNKIDPGVCDCGVADTDSDGDLSADCKDCDDADVTVYPGADELCDNIDNNCDGTVDEGLTQATSCGVGACAGNTGIETCSAGSWVGDTCDPFAGAVAELCDGLDNDCDGVLPANEANADGDAFMVCQGDCDDNDPGVHPQAAEICDDTIDNDCTGGDDLTPEATILYAPADPVQVGETISVRVGFSGADVGDTHSAVCYWGDLGYDDIDPINNDTVVEMPHTYNDPGVYTVRVTVSDDYCGGGEAIYEYVVVYDPSAGFVTGGGWIWSEAGWCQLNELCTNAEGKANFGFVSKYKKGTTVPTGNTEFNFSAGDLDFHSDEYEWLVVTQGDSNAQFKGNGRINGETCINGDNYRFMVWAGDHDPDTFRIKIYCEEADSSETVVYDNGFNQEIGGGSIVIHTGK